MEGGNKGGKERDEYQKKQFVDRAFKWILVLGRGMVVEKPTLGQPARKEMQILCSIPLLGLAPIWSRLAWRLQMITANMIKSAGSSVPHGESCWAYSPNLSSFCCSRSHA